jgi:hypothetical protein
MTAALRTFVMSCAGQFIFLLAGLPALLRTGQVDLLGWVWPALILVMVAAVIRMRRSTFHAVWIGAGSLGTVILFSSLAMGRLPGHVEIAWLSLIVILAVGAGLSLPRRRRMGLLLIGMAGLACWLSAEPPIKPTKERPVLAVISALPLFWRDGDGGIQSQSDAPIIKILRQRFDVRPIDSPLSPGMQGAKAVLLAQPRGLSDAELSSLDDWVRRGGNMVLLADPLLRWPSSLPLGDRRRAPAVTMLAPLLARWGVALLPPSSTGEERQMLADGRLLTTMAASSFAVRDPSNCRVGQNALIAHCNLGRGQAVLVADADLIDDRLWLVDEAAPLNMREWSADTPGFLVEQLGGGPVDSRSWLKSVATLTLALRWSIIAGIIWAIMGSVVSLGCLRGFVDRSFGRRQAFAQLDRE